MNYNGTISPEAMASIIAALRKNAADARRFSAQLVGKAHHHDSRTKLDERREVYDYVADHLEHMIQAERERILTPEGQ